MNITSSDYTYPLSHGQQALWFLYQLAPKSAAYNTALTLRIRSTLDVQALQNTFQALINRHPCLRTTFTTREGEPLQKVHQYHTVDFKQFDASTWSWDELNKQVVKAYQSPFDLEQGPVLRVSLFTRASLDNILLLTIHHIIFDARSLGLLIEELGVLYPAIKAGTQAELPAIKHSYADYVHWEREILASPKGKSLWSYWQQQLADAPSVLNLPTVRSRPPVQTYQGASVPFYLSDTLTQRIKKLARIEGASRFRVLLAAYQILLYRYTGQADIIVGSTTAGRTQSEFSDVVGYFVNNLVLRAVFKGELTFRHFLSQVNQTVLAAIEHQEYPFPLLVEHLQPKRDPSRTPLFQVDFNFIKSQKVGKKVIEFLVPGNTDAKMNVGTLEVEPFEMAQQEGQFDLALEMMDVKNSLVGSFKYNTDLFDESTITRMVGHFQTLLEGIVANPLQLIHALPLLTEAEQQQQLAWNDTTTDYPRDKTIVDLFEEQVDKTPYAIAVVFENQQLTYQALNTKANQLAHYLQTLGVKPEILVGICVERSIEMVIGLLGILKAGGAYLPLDPAYPAERLAFMLEDALVPVLLTQSSLKEKLPETQAQLVCLDVQAKMLSQFSSENIKSGVTSENLAYVIYTSGSTGKPKGVMIFHKALCNHTQWMQDTFPLNEKDKVLQKTSISFDASVWEFFAPLVAGAQLVMAQLDWQKDSSSLIEMIVQHQVTTVQMVPSLLQVIISLKRIETIKSLKRIFCGGEKLPLTLMAESLNILRIELINLYGPTEACIDATFLRCFPNHPIVPIGSPIANAKIYILDSHLQPVPLSVPGELHIGGVGLGQGYLNRPELTAEKFINNPFDDDPNSRLYKTGDLARYLPDGNIEYLGRIDNQVKIRGFRIELGEIEAVLATLPFVKENAVIVHEASQTDKRLVAYFVPHQGQVIENTTLRDFMAERLPDYMVPSAFVMLESLPLTPNGKIDRRALSQLSVIGYQLSEKTFVAPRTPDEELLADIWSSVLGIERVGVHDNFFELGGHSLQAVQLVSKIALATKIDISVKQLFLYPTIAQLATLLEKISPKRDPMEPSPSTSLRENHPISKGELIVSHSSPDFQLERRSLLSLLAAKKIQPVNAAALGYLPNSILEQSDLSREEMLEQWFDNLPVVSGIIETAWGRIALLLLPRFNSELYGDTDDIVDVTLDALEIAGHMGASTVSLTGVIPSATDYGRAIAKVMTNRRHLPQITTGHSTTSAAVVLAIQKVLQEGGREMATERVGVIGLGSIGLSSLRLMLKCLPHPAELMLCDLYAKKASLKAIRDQLISELGFHGKIQLLYSEVELPEEIYNATLIVGATNVPDVLDINQVKSGTLIVDDSGPHCFKSALAVKRFQTHQDILFTEGGVLKSPQPISEVIHLPHHLEKSFSSKQLEEFIKLLKRNPFEITGCVFSSVLSSVKNLKPTVGLVQLHESVKHYETLISLGFQAADLHCEDYVLPLEAISHFRGRFGH